MGVFIYNKDAFGGTEYMGRGFEKHILSEMPKLDNYLCAMAPGDTPTFDYMYESKKPIIFWLHNTPNQFGSEELEFFSDSRFINNLKYMIVPSESAKIEVNRQTSIPLEKVYVIPNAIDPLKYDSNKFNKPNKIKLINTSSPDRGLDILLNAINLVKEDFELDIFSRFNPTQTPNYIPDKRVNFYGFSYKGTVLKHYESAHIHVYPSTYPETFCISQAEAMSAGLLCVTSSIGALPEVSGGFTKIYDYTENKMEHVAIFADKLAEAIENIKSGSWNPEAQIEYVNKTYSWKAIKDKWLQFHELI